MGFPSHTVYNFSWWWGASILGPGGFYPKTRIVFCMLGLKITKNRSEIFDPWKKNPSFLWLKVFGKNTSHPDDPRGFTLRPETGADLRSLRSQSNHPTWRRWDFFFARKKKNGALRIRFSLQFCGVILRAKIITPDNYTTFIHPKPLEGRMANS